MNTWFKAASAAILVWASTGAFEVEVLGVEPMSRPIVIAHRGASGYLPEHTEGAKVLAIAQGADYVEQDVVLTRDKVFVVCHDVTLDESTNVKQVFPDRRRPDGHYYFADFDWNELLQLRVVERVGKANVQVFSHRFPGGFQQKLMRLEEEIKLVDGLNKTLGKNVGLYIELKRPAWHRENLQVDMGAELLRVLESQNVLPEVSPCFIQCFEADELKHLKQDLNTKFPLIHLLGAAPSKSTKSSTENNATLTPTERTIEWEHALRETAQFADGVGPSIDLMTLVANGEVVSNGFAEAAHKLGLEVHPYTVRKDALPRGFASLQSLHEFLIQRVKVDGFFTDFPDTGRSAVDSMGAESTKASK